MSGLPAFSDEDGRMGSCHFSLIPPVLHFSSYPSLHGFVATDDCLDPLFH